MLLRQPPIDTHAGQRTAAVFGELGVKADELALLRADRVV